MGIELLLLSQYMELLRQRASTQWRCSNRGRLLLLLLGVLVVSLQRESVHFYIKMMNFVSKTRIASSLKMMNFAAIAPPSFGGRRRQYVQNPSILLENPPCLVQNPSILLENPSSLVEHLSFIVHNLPQRNLIAQGMLRERACLGLKVRFSVKPWVGDGGDGGGAALATAGRDGKRAAADATSSTLYRPAGAGAGGVISH